MDIHAVYELVTAIFTAGVWFGIFLSMRKDVKGIGGRVTREEKRNNARSRQTSLALMVMAKDESQRQQIADLLKVDGEEK